MRRKRVRPVDMTVEWYCLRSWHGAMRRWLTATMFNNPVPREEWDAVMDAMQWVDRATAPKH